MEEIVLATIGEELEKLEVTYEYGEFKGLPTFPYARGEYSENQYTFETNGTSGEFILTCFNHGSELDLIELKDKIKKHFRDYRRVTEKGGISIKYRNSLFVQTGDEQLRRREIYLEIQYWESE